jgi:hypothetical protein
MTQSEFLLKRKTVFEKHGLTFAPFAAQGGGGNGKAINYFVPVDKLFKAYRLADSFGKGLEFWGVCYRYEKWIIVQFMNATEKKAVGYCANDYPKWLTPWSLEERASGKVLILLKEN